jgi:DNA polymerase III psi subunit
MMVTASRGHMLSTTHYLDLMGITQWQLRTVLAPLVLVHTVYHPHGQWLFILEKQEVMLESPLLQAIFTAIKQTVDTVNIAYYDTKASTHLMQPLSDLQYIVVMGEEALQQFQNHQYHYAPEIPIIISDNLDTLAQDINAKRKLWQQLKPYQT